MDFSFLADGTAKWAKKEPKYLSPSTPAFAFSVSFSA